MQEPIYPDISRCLLSEAPGQKVIKQVLRLASQHLGDLIEQRIGREADVYVFGLNYDFDGFARHYAVRLGERLVGAACCSSEVMRYPTDTGERLFASRMRFAEDPARKPAVAVVFIAVASDEPEITNAISAVSGKIGSAEVIVACALAAGGIAEATRKWLGEFDLPQAELLALHRTYETLDNRPAKAAVLMPIWIMERAFGPMPEHMRERYALRDCQKRLSLGR